MTVTERWSETDTDLMPRPSLESTEGDPRKVTPITEPTSPGAPRLRGEMIGYATDDRWMWCKGGRTRAAACASMTEMHGGDKARRGASVAARGRRQAAPWEVMQKRSQGVGVEGSVLLRRRQLAMEQCVTILWAGSSGRAARITIAPTNPAQQRRGDSARRVQLVTAAASSRHSLDLCPVVLVHPVAPATLDDTAAADRTTVVVACVRQEALF
jgi:hypothetical protein